MAGDPCLSITRKLPAQAQFDSDSGDLPGLEAFCHPRGPARMPKPGSPFGFPQP
jgi:hypothetical protein